MRLKSLPILLILMTHSLFGQNLIKNGGFEFIDGKVKEPGLIFLAPPWVAGTQATPDLYATKAKSDLVGVPINAYGDQEAEKGTGDNYAGILLYSHGAKKPRTYLTAKLKYSMLAGEWYCVKFNISFADLSKYACNNIGAYISHDSVGSNKDQILNYKPQIINSTNDIFEKQWGWESICRIFVAEGGEQFITIGNFAPQAETKMKSVKRPKGYTKTQIRDGYYYIDNISVIPNATKENCKCEPGQYQFAHLEKQESSFETAAEDIPDKVILGTTQELLVMDPTIEKKYEDAEIMFQKTKSILASGETDKLIEVIAVMKKDKEVTIEVIGHRDATEKVMSDLSQKRANQVSKYLISKGVSRERISTTDAGPSESFEGGSSKEEQARKSAWRIL